MAQYSPENPEIEEIEEIEEELDSSPEEMDEDEFNGYVGRLLQDAIVYADEQSQDRVTSSKFYSGHIPEQNDDGRSGAVSYDVRDTVNQILPSLMRVFFGANKIMQFTPKGPEDVGQAEQMSDYINNLILEQQPNFISSLMAVFKDALIRRTGVLKFWCEEKEEVKTSNFTGLDEQQAQILAGEDDVEEVVMETSGETSENIPLYNVTLKRRTKKVQ